MVMLLMLLAVRRASPAGRASSPSQSEYSRGGQAPGVVVERVVHSVRTIAGHRELAVEGYVENRGRKPVTSAELRCHFRTHAGKETFLEVPLIVESRLDELEGEPLMAHSSRKFRVRVGDFPDVLQPSVVSVEVVNIGVS